MVIYEIYEIFFCFETLYVYGIHISQVYLLAVVYIMPLSLCVAGSKRATDCYRKYYGVL